MDHGPVSDSDELNQPGSEIDSGSSDEAESDDELNSNIIWPEIGQFNC